MGKSRQNQSSVERKHSRKQMQNVKKKFVVFAFASVLTFGAYDALLGLLSSIKIVDGLGVASGAAIYTTSAVFGITCTPVVHKLLGLKWAIAASYCMYFLFMCANIYPNPYLLLVAAVCVGVAEGTIWPAYMTYCVHFARQYTRHGSKHRDFHNAEFVGYFFFAQRTAMAISYLSTYIILYAGRSTTVSVTNSTLNINGSDIFQARDLSVCGSNDCQDPNITQQNIVQYVPPQTALYVMYGLMASMVLAAIIIHCCFVEKPDDNLQSEAKRDCKIKLAKDGVLMVMKSEKPESKAPKETLSLKNQDEVADEEDTKESSGGNFQLAVTSLRETIQQMFRPKQLLLTPFSLYCGVVLSFIFSELPRAYASCILGVHQVGLCLLVFSVVDAFVSFFIGRISARTGRRIPLGVAMCIDIVSGMLWLLWIPTQSTTWVVYVLFVLVGIANGIRMTMNSDTHAIYFPENQQKAYVVWSFWYLLGYALQFGWSTRVCVRFKVYVQLALLFVTATCIGVAEILFSRRLKKY